MGTEVKSGETQQQRDARLERESKIVPGEKPDPSVSSKGESGVAHARSVKDKDESRFQSATKRRDSAIRAALEDPPEYPESSPSYPNFNPEGKTPKELSEDKDATSADFDPEAVQLQGEPQDKATIERNRDEAEERKQEARDRAADERERKAQDRDAVTGVRRSGTKREREASTLKDSNA